MRDALNAERRRLPMVRVEKDYRFQSPSGEKRLIDLFEGRQQLIIHHFMWIDRADEGCPGCSMLVDTVGNLVHLNAANTTLAFVSRAPLEKLEAFRARMGWTTPIVSSAGTDFNYDFHVTLDPSRGATTYNFRDVRGDGRDDGVVRGGPAGSERVPARRGRGLSHLLGVRPRHGAREQRLRLPRLHAARTAGRAGRAAVGAAPRSLRRLRTVSDVSFLHRSRGVGRDGCRLGGRAGGARRARGAPAADARSDARTSADDATHAGRTPEPPSQA